GGTLTVAATSGVATFSGLTLNKAATGDTLSVSGGGLTATTTSPITVNAAPATQVVVTTQPPSNVAAGSSFSLVVSAEDPFGNVVPGYTGNVAIALGNNPGGVTLGGTLNKAAVGGVATFTGLSLPKSVAGYTIQVSSGSLTGATTSPFNVAASQLSVT